MKVIGQILWRVLLIAGTVLLVAVALAAFSGEANAITRHSHRIRHDNRMFPPSKASLLAQNYAIDTLGLHRYRDDADIRAAVKRGELVSVDTATLDSRLPINRRYLRPAANNFLSILSIDFALRFGHNFVVTSAVRTMQTQKSLRRWNHNATTVSGPLASSHLAGTTFDIARRKMTRQEMVWVEEYLRIAGDRIIAEEENGQSCFHVMVIG